MGKVAGHRIEWITYGIPGHEKFVVGRDLHPSDATTRNGWVAWDAECQCGWRSGTGGAIKTRVREDVAEHLEDARRPIGTRMDAGMKDGRYYEWDGKEWVYHRGTGLMRRRAPVHHHAH